MKKLMPGANIGGFISLEFFKNNAFTIDNQKKILTIEADSALFRIKSAGVKVPISVDKNGISVSIQMPLILPNGTKISVVVDSGSQALILNDHFFDELKISKNNKNVKYMVGKDETGQQFRRIFTNLRGKIHVPSHPEINVESIKVMFQKIIYDGLAGQFFLKKFIITYDLKRSLMIFRRY
ncbi:hypothetical protein KKF34_18285 [Myxococcota bacterium]|nr:hypothetical protein [Myxococcota bacterium]MBU1383011.1 hypothetical protein [Myxococcota bacterium]MBU1498834.1 hypothetical protein [Myxococcota bacterium]